MSLRDEMLKAGLISEKQAKQAAHSQRRARKEQGEKLQREAKAAKAEAERQRAAERERDRQTGAQRAEAEAAKAREAAGKQKNQMALERVYTEGELRNWGGQHTYYYAHGRLIQALQVNDDAARRLEAGQAAIAAGLPPRQQPTLLSAAATRQLQHLAPEQVLCFHEGS